MKEIQSHISKNETSNEVSSLNACKRGKIEICIKSLNRSTSLQVSLVILFS